MLIAAALGASPVHAAEWNRIALPSGAGWVRVPCATNQLKAVEKDGASGVLCIDSGLYFGAIVGRIPGPNGPTGDYDAMLAGLKSEPTASIDESALNGHRAVTAHPDTQLTTLRIVEIAPDKLLMLVFDASGDGAAPRANPAVASDLATKFVGSLEFAAK